MQCFLHPGTRHVSLAVLQLCLRMTSRLGQGGGPCVDAKDDMCMHVAHVPGLTCHKTVAPLLTSPGSKRGRMLHVPPVYKIWAICMNQMPCSITSRARTVGIKPCTTGPHDVLHHIRLIY